jgi:hypothetical protein
MLLLPVGTFGIPFGGFLVCVANDVGNSEIIFQSSVSWSMVVDPSYSLFLHMSAVDAHLTSKMHFDGVSKCSLLQ